MSKVFGNVLFQHIALSTPADKMQILSFHPGSIWTEAWEKMGPGLKPEDFDDKKTDGPTVQST